MRERIAGGDRVRDASGGVVVQHVALYARERRLELGQDVDAVAAVLDHRGDAAHLSLDPAQAAELPAMVGVGVVRAVLISHTAAYTPVGHIGKRRIIGRESVMQSFSVGACARILVVAVALATPGATFAQAMPGMVMPATPAQAPAGPQQQNEHQRSADPQAGRDIGSMGPMTGMDQGAMQGDGMAGMSGMGGMTMRAAFGPYPMNREASGTSWQPDATPMQGVMKTSGKWTFMAHAMLNGVYDSQSGRRGDDKAFVSGMVMGMATGALSPRDTVQFRAMLSPDPLMGSNGYPLLLATGETANGRDPLIDRQHPHDLFMELSASYSRKVADRGSAFVYFGLPGEPAFGPPAFMHRLSIMDSPEAPISHHWLDSTHITYGVLTAGVTWGGVKVEASRFKGREPDQHRYDIETPKFDSTAARVSWNPTRTLALQASYAYQKSPEQLQPDEDQERWSASAIFTKRVGTDGWFASTFAWGRRIDVDHGEHAKPLDAYILEASLAPDDRWTVFARAERIENDELLPAPGQVKGPEFTVGKASVGAIRDFRLSPAVKVGIGGLVARSLTPGGLDSAYGGDRTSGMGFVRFKLGMRAGAF